MWLNQHEIHLAHCGEGNCSLPSSPAWAVAAKTNRVWMRMRMRTSSVCQYPEFSISKKWNFCFFGCVPPAKRGESQFATKLKCQGMDSCSGCLWESFSFPVEVLYRCVVVSSMSTKVNQQSWCLPAKSMHTRVGKAGQENWIRCCFWVWLGGKSGKLIAKS